MTPKKRLLQMKTYEEYRQGRELLSGLKPDKEVLEHLSKLFGKSPNPPEELYRTPPYQQCQNCQHWKGYNGCSLYPSVLKEKPKLSDGILCSCHTTKAKA